MQKHPKFTNYQYKHISLCNRNKLQNVVTKQMKFYESFNGSIQCKIAKDESITYNLLIIDSLILLISKLFCNIIFVINSR